VQNPRYVKLAVILPETDGPGGITRILEQLRNGEPGAIDRLAPVAYQELRKLAHGYLKRERPDHTLQATALVNEVYLRMVAKPDQNFANRAHFFGVAAAAMRHILVDWARARHSEKRGGPATALPIDEGLVVGSDNFMQVLLIHDALERLAKLNPRQAKIVEMRFFAGLPVEEIAEAMGVATRTIIRDWVIAQAWLQRELSQ
jgi:RNA polymerase sigma-70 factor (ECF subfamily)